MSEKLIPLSVPNLKGKELEYVTTAVKTEWVSTSGPYVGQFEKTIASYVNINGAVACQNGTSGLHIALILTGVMPGEEVIVPTLTFIATVNPVKYIGAEPVFMDCDDSLCMDPVKLAEFCKKECTFDGEKLTDKATGRRVCTILVVHVFGNMADMVKILYIANKYKLKVIEDATEAVGTYYTSGPLAGCHAGTMGDVGVYSFNGNKIITTGGGGMILSNSDVYIQIAKHLTTQAKADGLYYIHDAIGFNYRMTNLQAALGLGQIEQLEKFIEIKEQNYKLYQELLEPIQDYKILPFRQGTRSNHWFYSLACLAGSTERDFLISYMAEHKVQSRPIWRLVSEQKPYADSRSYNIERAKYYWEHVINIPCSTNLTAEEVRRVVDVIARR